MSAKNNLWVIIVFALILLIGPDSAFAQDNNFSFQAEVNAENINVRTDSTTTSEIICKANRGDYVEVVSEKYDWRKIRLPKNAPSFVKKDLTALIEEEETEDSEILAAKILTDNVNIRLLPNESAPILGRVNKDEVINILEDLGEWYKIEPVNNSFGWIHKKFIDKVDSEIALAKNKVKDKDKKGKEGICEDITIEGIIKPYGKVFRRKTTHKLITQDNQIYLLKGNKETLNTLTYHKVRVAGKLISDSKEKYPAVEILKAEILD